jgi:hypothetical protein
VYTLERKITISQSCWLPNKFKRHYSAVVLLRSGLQFESSSCQIRTSVGLAITNQTAFIIQFNKTTGIFPKKVISIEVLVLFNEETYPPSASVCVKLYVGEPTIKNEILPKAACSNFADDLDNPYAGDRVNFGSFNVISIVSQHLCKGV